MEQGYQVDALTQRLINLFEGNAALALYVLVALAVIVLAFSVERLIFYYKARVKPNQVVKSAEKLWSDGSYDDAIVYFSVKSHWLYRVFESGFRSLKRSKGTHLNDRIALLEEAFQASITLETQKLSRFTGILATIGAIAPYVGLIGTVIGVLEAFSSLSAQNDQIDQGKLMGDIAHALIATAAGLAVAIPSVVIFNAFRRRVNIWVEQMEVAASEFTSLLTLAATDSPDNSNDDEQGS